MLNLTAVDWLILLLSLAFAVGIGMALKGGIKTARDFFQAGQALPAWVCGLAFIAAGVGAQEVIGMGAAGARYGLAAAHIGSLAVLPAMLFVGLFMMPSTTAPGPARCPSSCACVLTIRRACSTPACLRP